MVIHDNEADGAGNAEEDEQDHEGDEEVVGEEEQDEDESTANASYIPSSHYRYILPAPYLTTTTLADSAAATPILLRY